MQAYATERGLGQAIFGSEDEKPKPVALPPAVMQYQAVIDAQVTDKEWRMSDRDTTCEIVVPEAVLEQLGKDTYAGQLVVVTSTNSADVEHIARIIPAEVCKYPVLSPAAAEALDLDTATCTTSTGQAVAVLSPLLAFNLGIPYPVNEFMLGSDTKKRLLKKGTVSISPLDCKPADDDPTRAYRRAWVPGNTNVQLPAATHVGLAFCQIIEKQPPFNVVDFQENMQAAAQAMQGMLPPKQDEDMKDEEVEEIAAQQQKQRESDQMEALRTFMNTPRFICLGDVIPLVVKTTPLLGPLQTVDTAEDEPETKVVYMKVVELSTQQDFESHKLELVKRAALWQSSSNVLLSHHCGSATPVGVESYLLDAPPGKEPTNGALPAAPKGVGCLGRTAFATLEDHHELARGKLLSGIWRQLATQMLPFMAATQVPSAALGAGGGGRLAMLLTGPQGAGKASEVFAAAKALGLHVMDIDCRALASGNPMDEAECIVQLETVLMEARKASPTVLLLRKPERIFPPQPNQSVVRRFAETLTRANSAYCHPHIPEVTKLSEAPPTQPEEPEPPVDLPWDAMLPPSERRSRTTPIQLPPGMTRARLNALHRRFPPGVIFVAGTTSQVADIPVTLRRAFTVEFKVGAADEAHRARLMAHMLADASALDEDDLRSAAQSTAGFLPADLGGMMCDATLAVLRSELESANGAAPRQSNAISSLSKKVEFRHIEDTLAEVRKRTALDIGAPRIPQVKWDDVGGLEHVKKAILETIELPLRFRDLFSSGLKRRSGVLLYGPPGTGKTLIAKAVATETSINFMSVKGPELMNMYVGESEKNVRDVFEKARKAQPCILFFDELDSLAPRRGNGMDSSHVSDRIVAQLLAELDGIGGGRNDVFLIGATNRPDLLDSALMRPGRLDVLLYVGVDRTPESKAKVLHALTRKFKLAGDVDMDALARSIPAQCTGADLYGLCADAWMQALRARIAELVAEGRASHDSDEAYDLDDVEVVVDMADFVRARENLVPSLTMADLDRYDKLQDQYSPSNNRNSNSGGASGGGADGNASAPVEAAPKLTLRPGGVGKLPARPKKAAQASIGLDSNGSALNSVD